jgi:hypothetical protein
VTRILCCRRPPLSSSSQTMPPTRRSQRALKRRASERSASSASATSTTPQADDEVMQPQHQSKRQRNKQLEAAVSSPLCDSPSSSPSERDASTVALPSLLQVISSRGGMDPFMMLVMQNHLSVTEWAAVYGTCHALRSAITAHRGLVCAAKRTRTVCSSTLLKLADCAWARPFFIELNVNMRPQQVKEHPVVKKALQLHEQAQGNTAAAAAAGASASSSLPLFAHPSSSSLGLSPLPSALLRACDEPYVPLRQVAAALAKFPRLTRVGLQMYRNDAASRDEWRDALNMLPRMQSIHLLTARAPERVAGSVQQQPEPAVGAPQAQQMAAVPAAPAGAAPAPTPIALTAASALLLEVGCLKHLSVLTLGNLHEPMSLLSFSVLPLLPALSALTVTMAPSPRTPSGSTNPELFHCSPEQTMCLSRCALLSSLCCGVWSRPWFENEAVRTRMDASPRGVKMLRCGIALLAAGKKRLQEAENQRAAAAQAARTSSTQTLPPPTAAPLMQLQLDGTLISSNTWEAISQIDSLTALQPLAWYADVSEEDFAKLKRFKQLKAFSLAAMPEESHQTAEAMGAAAAGAVASPFIAPRLGPLTASRFLPSLMHCSQLRSLHLTNVDLNAAQLDAAIDAFPQLSHLSLCTLRVDSVHPLRKALRLQQLSLYFCTQGQLVQGHDVAKQDGMVSPTPSKRELVDACGKMNFRLTLPPLPSLCQLLLHERVRISAADAEPLNQAMFARMPNLKPRHLQQNLLSDPAIV